MKPSSRKLEKLWTYADLCQWPEGERWELIDGVAYDMTPAPSRLHQDISSNFNDILKAFFKGTKCKVYYAPFDVRLPKTNEPDEEIRTVVQPDLVVICDEKKLDEKGCRGAPDLVVEILSPSTSSKDQVKKLNLYENQGVKEFWVIDPNGTVMIFNLQKGARYGRPATYDRAQMAHSTIFPDLSIDLSTVFPKEEKIVRESPRKYLSSRAKSS